MDIFYLPDHVTGCVSLTEPGWKFEYNVPVKRRCPNKKIDLKVR
jgi:hypothetical protein